MVFWRKKQTARPEEIAVSKVTFVVEQEENPEQELKAKLVEHFERNINLNEAFLVRVRYGAAEELKVALCLEAKGQDSRIITVAAAEFRKMFGSHESLDIMFLTPAQRQEILRVAKPFYTRST
jgi:hypothetical protein